MSLQDHFKSLSLLQQRRRVFMVLQLCAAVKQLSEVLIELAVQKLFCTHRSAASTNSTASQFMHNKFCKCLHMLLVYWSLLILVLINKQSKYLMPYSHRFFIEQLLADKTENMQLEKLNLDQCYFKSGSKIKLLHQPMLGKLRKFTCNKQSKV